MTKKDMHQYYNDNPHLLLTLSIEQAAAVSGFSSATIAQAYERGEFGMCTPEDLIRGRIPREELERWIKANMVCKPVINYEDNELKESGFKKRRKYLL